MFNSFLSKATDTWANLTKKDEEGDEDPERGTPSASAKSKGKANRGDASSKKPVAKDDSLPDPFGDFGDAPDFNLTHIASAGSADSADSRRTGQQSRPPTSWFGGSQPLREPYTGKKWVVDEDEFDSPTARSPAAPPDGGLRQLAPEMLQKQAVKLKPVDSVRSQRSQQETSQSRQSNRGGRRSPQSRQAFDVEEGSGGQGFGMTSKKSQSSLRSTDDATYVPIVSTNRRNFEDTFVQKSTGPPPEQEKEKPSRFFPFNLCVCCTICPERILSCIPGPYRLVQTWTHLFLLVGVWLSGLLALYFGYRLWIFVNEEEPNTTPVPGQPADDGMAGGLQDSLGIMFMMPAIAYFMKTISQFDQDLREKQEQVRRNLKKLTDELQDTLKSIDVFLADATDAGLSLAEKGFESKKKDFLMFLQAAQKKITNESLESEEDFLQLRHFIDLWGNVFGETTIDPVNYPRLVAQPGELDRCRSPEEFLHMYTSKLKVLRVDFITSQKVLDQKIKDAYQSKGGRNLAIKDTKGDDDAAAGAHAPPQQQMSTPMLVSDSSKEDFSFLAGNRKEEVKGCCTRCRECCRLPRWCAVPKPKCITDPCSSQSCCGRLCAPCSCCHCCTCGEKCLSWVSCICRERPSDPETLQSIRKTGYPKFCTLILCCIRIKLVSMNHILLMLGSAAIGTLMTLRVQGVVKWNCQWTWDDIFDYQGPVCGTPTYNPDALDLQRTGVALALLVIFLVLLFVLAVFEDIDVVQQLQREAWALAREKTEVAQMQQDTKHFWQEAEQLMDLWLHRTIPRLNLYGKIHEYIEDMPIDTLTNQLPIINEALELFEQSLPAIQDWRHDGGLDETSAKAFQQKLNDAIQVRSLPKLLHNLEGVKGHFAEEEKRLALRNSTATLGVGSRNSNAGAGGRHRSPRPRPGGGVAQRSPRPRPSGGATATSSQGSPKSSSGGGAMGGVNADMLQGVKLKPLQKSNGPRRQRSRA